MAPGELGSAKGTLLDLLGSSLLLGSRLLLLHRLHLGCNLAFGRRFDLGSGGWQDALDDLAHRGLNGARRVGISKGTGNDEGQSSTRGSKESLIGVVVIRLQFICTASYPTDETRRDDTTIGYDCKEQTNHQSDIVGACKKYMRMKPAAIVDPQTNKLNYGFEDVF